MGKIIIYGNKSGEGGADTSVVTATASDVLVGKIIVNADGEPISGTMANNGTVNQTLSAGGSYIILEGYHSGAGKVNAKTLAEQTIANATADQILSGSTAWVNGTQVTGTMTNQGSKSSSVNAGGSYTIPAGYHDGTGKVTGNALSSQTSGTAAASDIVKDRTAWVNGSQITGTMTNHGAITQSLNCGGSYTIPVGYHNGQGKVTANSLSSQTSGTATAAQILSSQTAWVNGSKLTGTMTNNGAKTATYTPNDSTQTYTIPAGYHNGSGKITINKVPSSYTKVADGLTFFDAGGIGQWAKNLGFGLKYPQVGYYTNGGVWNGSGSEFGGSATGIDTSKFTLTRNNTPLFEPGTSNAGGGWGTRKTIDFTYWKTFTIDFWTYILSSSSYLYFYIYNLQNKKCWYWRITNASETYNISAATGHCIFGFKGNSGGAVQCHLMKFTA